MNEAARSTGPPTHTERELISLPPGHSHDCSSLRWQERMLVVEQGSVVLQSAGGSIPLAQGAIFFLAGLSAPVLRNPHSEPAVISTLGKPTCY